MIEVPTTSVVFIGKGKRKTGAFLKTKNKKRMSVQHYPNLS